MIDAAQIRAARALLGWTTAKLAEESGLTANGLNKIERSHVVPQKDTVEKLQFLFESQGVEFLPGSGVRRRNDFVSAYEGGDANRSLALDIYEHLSALGGGELMIYHANEEEASRDLGPTFMKEQLERRREAHITHRVLVCENVRGLYPELEGAYHQLKKNYFSRFPLFIYGSRLALLSFSSTVRVVIIEDERISRAARKLFDFVWDHTQGIDTVSVKAEVIE